MIQVNNKITQSNYDIRVEMLDDQKYFVVPVVMMVPGVHAGSRGPLLHTDEVLSASVEHWTGMPVTVQHPIDGEGRFVSARTQPDCKVGHLKHVRYEGDKLRAEAWLNERKLIAASPEAMQHVRDKQPLDVSVGVFSVEVEAAGEWNGEEYAGIATNHIPDHLALLPGGRGACSWADGCGVRVNSETLKKEDKCMDEKEKPTKENPIVNETKTDDQHGGKSPAVNTLLTVLKELNGRHYNASLIVNETGYSQVMEKIQSKLNGMDNDLRLFFLEEVFEDSFIYRVRKREGDGQSKMYKQNYSILENQELEFAGEPQEVRREVEYVTMEATAMRRTKVNTKGADNITNHKKIGVNSMKDEKEKSPCFVAKVDALIANAQTKFDEADKEWLLTQSEETLVKLEPVEPAKTEEQEELQINRDQALQVLNLKELKDFTGIMPEAMRKQVESGLKLREDTRSATIKDILANTADVWAEDELKEFSCEKLTKLQRSIKPVVDYSGAGAGGDDVQVNEEHGEEPLMPAGVEKKTK